MSFWAIIPVKPFREGKSRLRSLLNDDQRAILNRNLFINTLQKAKEVKQIENGVIVSRDVEALAIAESFGYKAIREGDCSDLNSALNLGVSFINSEENQGLLILPADLPLISTEDIVLLINQAVEPPMVVLVPDRWRQGTNCLLINPKDLIPFTFGLGSFRTHQKLAQLSGAEVKVFHNKNISIDLDLPEDYPILDEHG